MSDSIDPTARSRIFSLYTGTFFAGMAIGPALGAVLTQYTQDLLTVFYISTALHFLYAFTCFFILPEPLDEKHRAAAAERYRASKDPNSTWLTAIKHAIWAFAQPLTVFIPRRRLRGKGRDWSLACIGIADALAMLTTGAYTFYRQYVIAIFGWETTELAAWISLVGISRAAYLLCILPILLKLLHAVYRARRHVHIDIFIAKFSLYADLLSFIVKGTTTNPKIFVVATCWSSLGGGFGPFAQSIAMTLCRDQADATKPTHPQTYSSAPSTDTNDPKDNKAMPLETGRLFGAFSVLQTLTSEILGPPLYGVVFATTIASAPRAMFWLSGACIACGLVALWFVRPREDAREQVDEESRLL